MRVNDTLSFLLTDHLGSTSLTTNASGGLISELRYTAWGSIRYASGTTPTHYTFTGQYSNMTDFGLMFYNARWYDPALGRFAQADSLVPPGVQGYDRYAYVNNSPINYTDPSGHMAWEGDSGGCNEVMKCIKEKRDAAIAEQQAYNRKCAAGNANYCSGWANSKERFIVGMHIGGGDTIDIGYGGYAYEQTDIVFDFESGTIYKMTTTGEGTYVGVPNGAALEGYFGTTNVHGIPSSATPDQVADLLAGPNIDIAADIGLDLLPDVETSVGKGLSIDMNPNTGKPFITSAGLMYTTETKVGAGVSLLPLPLLDVGVQGGHSQTAAKILFQIPLPFR